MKIKYYLIMLIVLACSGCSSYGDRYAITNPNNDSIAYLIDKKTGDVMMVIPDKILYVGNFKSAVKNKADKVSKVVGKILTDDELLDIANGKITK